LIKKPIKTKENGGKLGKINNRQIKSMKVFQSVSNIDQTKLLYRVVAAAGLGVGVCSGHGHVVCQ
jgi:hypothetical protein